MASEICCASLSSEMRRDWMLSCCCICCMALCCCCRKVVGISCWHVAATSSAVALSTVVGMGVEDCGRSGALSGCSSTVFPLGSQNLISGLGAWMLLKNCCTCGSAMSFCISGGLMRRSFIQGYFWIMASSGSCGGAEAGGSVLCLVVSG